MMLRNISKRKLDSVVIKEVLETSTVIKKSKAANKNKAVDKKSKTVDKKSKTVDKKSKTVDKKSKTLDKKSKTVDQESKTVDQKSKADYTEKDIGYQDSSSLNTIYSNNNITLLLKDYFQNVNIDVYLFKATEDHTSHIVDNLKYKLIQDTKDNGVSDVKFYIIIEHSLFNDPLKCSATILKLYNKNRIKILPVVGSTSGLLRDQLKEVSELRRISIKVDDLSEWFREKQVTTFIYLDKLVEVIKLCVKHKAPSKVPDYEIAKIMSASSTKYEKFHKELLLRNIFEITDLEEIDQLSLVDTNQDELIAGSIIEKTVTWDLTVEDNEGHTISKKNNKKLRNEIEKYFEQCITSWHWDKKIWEKYCSNTNELNSDNFQHLFDKYGNRIRGKFGSHILKKHRYDCPDCYQGCDQVKKELLNRIIDGYIVLTSYSPNLLMLLRYYEKSILESFSQNDIDMVGFYNARPELKLINLIEKRINLDTAEKDSDYQGYMHVDKTDIEASVDASISVFNT